VSKTSAQTGGPLVLVGTERGITLIPRPTPLTRLNYFDGKFLRADDLSREQHYLRSLVELANRAGGWGVVHGFDTVLGSQRATIDLGPGLAIDPAGRTLYLPHAASVSVRELLEKSRRFATAGGAQQSRANGRGAFDLCEVDEPDTEEPGSAFPTDLYLISIAHVEALCGEEDVYGKLCEDACVTSSQRPYRLEGVVVRAAPLTLRPGACDAPWLTARHLRSRVAAAYFAAERRRLGRLMSGARLREETWCLGARAEPGNDVPIAVVAVNGGAVDFLDAWTARRERMETPARRYWAWQMMMRPWNVYLAQILQFQCHLRDVLDGAPDPAAPTDPCADRDEVIRSAVDTLTSLEGSQDLSGALQQLVALNQSFKQVLASASKSAPKRILIGRGIVELPSAGYLPVSPGGPVGVETQVRRLLGEGVDLRFCAVRPDFVAHALEEAQHMERICLLQGLEDPTRLEEVDILVPDGEFLPGAAVARLYDVRLELSIPVADPSPAGTGDVVTITRARGVGRAAPISGGGAEVHLAADAGTLEAALTAALRDVISDLLGPALSLNVREGGAWLSLRIDENPYERAVGDSVGWRADVAVGLSLAVEGGDRASLNVGLHGSLSLSHRGEESSGVRVVMGALTVFTGMSAHLNGNESATESGSVTLELRAELRLAAAGESSLVVRLDHEDGGARLNARWQQKQVDADVSVTVMEEGEWHLRDQQGPTATISGRVIDAATNEPIPAAQVRIAEEDLSTSTSAAGAYSLDIRGLLDRTGSEGLELVVVASHAGYRDVRTGPIFLSPNLQSRVVDFELRAPETHDIATLEAEETTAVLAPSHPAHQAALSGIRRVADAREDAAFRTSAEQALFAPVAPPVEGSTLRATRDWVLFHRRRTKRCGVVEEPGPLPPLPPPTVVRRYRLFHVQSPPDASMERLRTLIRGAQPIPGMASVSATARFEGGSAVLATPPSELQNAWRAANPEERIVYGAIAAAGPAVADSPAVQEARLQQVTAMLSGVTEAGGATFDLLDAVPAHLDATGAEGAMVFVTASPCTAVRRDSGDLVALHAGVLSCFQIAFSGYDDHEGQVLASGLLADEFYATDTLTERVEVDRRAITQNNSVQLRVYRDLQRARRAAEHAAALFAALPDPTAAQRTMHAEVLNLGGFTYVLFAENYCSGVPHSTTQPDGTVSWGAPQNRQQLLERASRMFSEALALAQGLGSAAQQNLARVGLARTLTIRAGSPARWQEALSIAQQVPLNFVYQIEHADDLPRQLNGTWSLSRSRRAYSVADRHGRNGLPFRGANDPRVTFEEPPVSGIDARLAHFALLKYPAANAPVVLASGIETRLIIAEARLALGENPAAVLQHVNEVRAAAGLPPLPGGLSGEQLLNQIFLERAFSLFATSHRLGDLRRLVRPQEQGGYGRPVAAVYPTGPYTRPQLPNGDLREGDFGDHVSLLVPVDPDNPGFQPAQCNPRVP
jgi:hypothetical protein